MQSSLFEGNPGPEKNLLPYDGVVNYFGPIYPKNEADKLSKILLKEIQWQNDKALVFGKIIETKRMVAWYADDRFPYRYSGTTKVALPWTKNLLAIKNHVQEVSGESFNSCLLNLYHNGSEGMAWHSDGEKELRKEGAIASISLGAERKFSFKHKKSKQRIDVFLENGSLLIMKGTTQEYWLHRLPPTKKVNDYRINLTFRQINLSNN